MSFGRLTVSKYLVLSLTVFLSGCYMDEESIVNNANINTHTRITADSITDDKTLPTPNEHFTQTVAPHYSFGCSVPVFNSRTYPKIDTKINPDYSSDSDKGVETDSDSEA